MQRTRWLSGLAGLGLTLLTSVGCQTYIPTTGQTLPSGRYLEHPPQYIPPSPPFPLQRELTSMERTAASIDAGGLGAPAPLPVPVPVPGGPGDILPVPPPAPLPPPAP